MTLEYSCQLTLEYSCQLTLEYSCQLTTGVQLSVDTGVQLSADKLPFLIWQMLVWQKMLSFLLEEIIWTATTSSDPECQFFFFLTTTVYSDYLNRLSWSM